MKIFLISIVALLVVGGVVAGGWAFRYYTAEIRGTVDAEEQIQSAPLRITAYNRFFDLCSAIQGHEATLQAQRNQLEQLTNESDRNRVLANIAGIEAQRARSIATYNNDARKDYTIGQFRSSELPYQLDVNGVTRC